jgi:hypothetical protein
MTRDAMKTAASERGRKPNFVLIPCYKYHLFLDYMRLLAFCGIILFLGKLQLWYYIVPREIAVLRTNLFCNL